MSHCTETCPLCGGANDCQMATTGAYKGPCWCVNENVPPCVLERVPEEARRTVCVCRRCVIEARRGELKSRPAPHPQAGDFYVEGHLVVFTGQYHRRRGYCCGSGCRHCPFDAMEREIAFGPPRKLAAAR